MISERKGYLIPILRYPPPERKYKRFGRETDEPQLIFGMESEGKGYGVLGDRDSSWFIPYIYEDIRRNPNIKYVVVDKLNGLGKEYIVLDTIYCPLPQSGQPVPSWPSQKPNRAREATMQTAKEKFEIRTGITYPIWPEVIEYIKIRHFQSASPRKIADELGTTHTTIRALVKEYLPDLVLRDRSDGVAATYVSDLSESGEDKGRGYKRDGVKNIQKANEVKFATQGSQKAALGRELVILRKLLLLNLPINEIVKILNAGNLTRVPFTVWGINKIIKEDINPDHQRERITAIKKENQKKAANSHRESAQVKQEQRYGPGFVQLKGWLSQGMSLEEIASTLRLQGHQVTAKAVRRIKERYIDT